MDKQLKQSDNHKAILQSPRLYAEHCRKKVLIGIFYRNGVWDERPETCGISYAVDGLLFERLCDLGLDVQATTNYGFSEFIISTTSKRCLDDLNLARQTLLDTNFDPDDFDDWQSYMVGKSPLNKWEYAYDRQRFPGTRLEFPIRGTSTHIGQLTLEMASFWRKCYVAKSQMFFCITGALTDTIKQTFLNTPELMWLPTNPITPLSKRFPSTELNTANKASGMVLSYPCMDNQPDLIQFEAFCELIKICIRPTLDLYSAEVDLPMFVMDPVPELRIKFNCSIQDASAMAHKVRADIAACLEQLNDQNLQFIRKELKDCYSTIKKNPYEWIHFVGWNTVMGPWCNVDELYVAPHYFDNITGERIRYAFAALNCCQGGHVFFLNT